MTRKALLEKTKKNLNLKLGKSTGAIYVEDKEHI